MRMWFTVREYEEQQLGVTFGAVDNDQITIQSRTLEVSMVVGNEDVNNFTFQNRNRPKIASIPLSNDPNTIKHIVAQLVQKEYEQEYSKYQAALIASIVQTEKAKFSSVPFLVDTFHYEAPTNKSYNKKELLQKMSDCTREYLPQSDVASCSIWMNYSIERIYSIDNTGSLTVCNNNSTLFVLSLRGLNGENLQKEYLLEDPDDLLPIDVLRKDASELYMNLVEGNSAAANIYHRIRPYDDEMETYNDASSDGLFRSLQDEIDANLDALRINDNYPPYYISYLVADAEVIEMTSSLGNLLRYQNKNERTLYPTVKIGMDLLNNEHYKPNRTPVYPLPLENNYNALRSSIWAITNETYTHAVEDYLGKQNFIQHKQIDVTKLPADRSVEKTTNNIQHKQYETLDITQIQNHLDDISSIFLKDKTLKQNINQSYIYYNSYRGNVYFLASDGVQYAQPIDYIRIYIYASTNTIDGACIEDRQEFIFAEIDDSWVWDSIATAAYRLGYNLIERSKSQQVSETYYGPVLFVNEAVPNIFAQASIHNTPTLLNVRTILTTDDYSDIERGDQLSSYVNRQIISSIFDIYAQDQMRTYNEHPLIGAYNIDAEGVAVEAKTQLVHRGELISLLTNREATANSPNSNGHQRFLISNANKSGVTTGPGAGVLVLSSHLKMDEKKLEKELRKQAQSAGYQYAYIVERIIEEDPWKLSCIAYRVDVRTGKKTLMQNASIDNPTIWHFRTATATSNQETFLNTLIGDPFYRSHPYLQRVSVITPSAILFSNWGLSIY